MHEQESLGRRVFLHERQIGLHHVVDELLEKYNQYSHDANVTIHYNITVLKIDLRSTIGIYLEIHFGDPSEYGFGFGGVAQQEFLKPYKFLILK